MASILFGLESETVQFGHASASLHPDILYLFASIVFSFSYWSANSAWRGSLIPPIVSFSTRTWKSEISFFIIVFLFLGEGFKKLFETCHSVKASGCSCVQSPYRKFL